jgi:hypothetical protein
MYRLLQHSVKEADGAVGKKVEIWIKISAGSPANPTSPLSTGTISVALQGKTVAINFLILKLVVSRW